MIMLMMMTMTMTMMTVTLEGMRVKAEAFADKSQFDDIGDFDQNNECVGDHVDDENYCVYGDNENHIVTIVTINIATGETSQAITPFHFFDNLNFHHLINFITRYLFSPDNFHHWVTFITG